MAFKGKSTIELRNAETGELEFKTEDENMVTNAVYNLINHYGEYCPKSDFYVGKLEDICSPLIDQLFSGLLLFESNITEDVNMIFPPAQNVPIGNAQRSITTLDPYTGTLNGAETKNLENGKRYVWDFGTDKANGTIRSVCLTSVTGGNCGIRPKAYSNNGSQYVQEFFMPYIAVTGSSLSKNGFPVNYNTTHRKIVASVNDDSFYPVGCFGENEYTFAKGNSKEKTKIFRIKKYKPKVVGLLSSAYFEESEKAVTSSKFFGDSCRLFTDGEKIYSFCMTSQNSFDFIVVNGKTLEVEKEESITVQDAEFSYSTSIYYGSTSIGAFYDGYFYIAHKSLVKIYKINVQDISDYALIDSGLTTSAYYESPCFEIIGNYLSYKFQYSGAQYRIIDFGKGFELLDVWGVSTFSHCGIKSNFIKAPYQLFKFITTPKELYISVYTLFLSTINNLSTPVVKNETQTMKVTYEITEI